MNTRKNAMNNSNSSLQLAKLLVVYTVRDFAIPIGTANMAGLSVIKFGGLGLRV